MLNRLAQDERYVKILLTALTGFMVISFSEIDFKHEELYMKAAGWRRFAKFFEKLV